MSTGVNVKDYILPAEELEEIISEQESTTKVRRCKPVVDYKLVLENETDFVLRRITSRTERELVILMSQRTFYIKDCVKNTIEMLNFMHYNTRRESIKKINKFLSDLTGPIFLDKLYWLDTLSSFSFSMSCDLFKPGTIDMIHDCVYNKDVDMAINEKVYEFYKKNKKLFKVLQEVHKRKSEIADDDYPTSFLNLCDIAFGILEISDFNNAKHFLECFDDSDLRGIGYCNATKNTFRDLIIGIVDYGNIKDINRLTEYITHDFSSQGSTRIITDILGVYKDYLRMSKEMHGKVECKYPKYLKTEHDKVVKKYNYYLKFKKESRMLEISQDNKKFEYKDKEYTIILPTKTADVVDEGVNQSHCVGSYVNKIISGEVLILFMRKVGEEENSLLTISIVKDGEGDYVVDQVRGFANRHSTEKEDDFIKKWAKNKGLKLTYK